LFQDAGEARVHGDGRLIQMRLDGKAQPTARGDLPRSRFHGLQRLSAALVVCVAHVQACANLGWNHIRGAWIHIHTSDGCHQPLGAARQRFDCVNPFRRARQRVAPQVHGGSACVIGLTFEAKRQAALPGDGLH